MAMTKGFQSMFSYFVEDLIILGNGFENIVHLIIVFELFELLACFNLPYKILFKNELIKIIALLLLDLNLSYVLKLWVNSYPQDRTLKFFNLEHVFENGLTIL